MPAEWIDITRPLTTGMAHWPGDPEVHIERVAAITAGDECNVTALSMSAHTGTHVDAPLHYFIHGAAVDAMPLEVGFGPARVIEIRDCLRIGRQELEQYSLRRGDRILLRTQMPTRFPDYVSLTQEAAEYMVACGVVLVGIDTLSIGSADEGGAATHCTLLAASVWIVEGLDLSEVEAGEYDLVCLPLRIAGADGAPARVLIRPR